MREPRWIAFLAGFAALLPTDALAYIGPGAGLGLIGALLAVIGAILVALFGLIVFPITLLRKRRKNKAQKTKAAAAGNTAMED